MRKLGVLRSVGVYIATLVLVATYPLAGIAGAEEVASTPSTSPDTSEPTYTYNEQTGHWDSSQWQYNPATGVYEKPPAPVIITPPTQPTVDSTSTPTTPSVDSTNNSTADTSTTTDANITNDVNSSTTTGDAAVTQNTTGGNATTGDALSTATILNNVNSTIGLDNNSKVANFTQNVLGDVNGDIVLSPLILKAMLEAKAPANVQSSATVNNNLNVDNNLNIQATSGGADVSGNTTAGNATSGSATAVANVVNILNSLIATQQSFVGTVNIYGNLNGDILIAPDFIPTIIANNGADTSGPTAQVSSQDTQSIINNISAVASSGAASVFGNTTAGSATSGNAQTNVVIFNLSGHQIIAQNSLLVFVNVLGKWVGVIVDAPQGATSALIGNGVVADNYTPDLTVKAQSQYGITNTIAVDAQTGNATVANNTSAGSAKTGDAKAMVNVANIAGSQLSLTGWFGILFINVFQNWYGSFGINTPYGDPVSPTSSTASQPVEFVPKSTTYTASSANLKVFDSRSLVNSASSANVEVASSNDNQLRQQVVLGDSISKTPLPSSQDFRLLIIAGSMLLIGFAIIGIKRLLG